jgi:hypothetical protein
VAVNAEEQLQRAVVQLLALYAGRGLLAFAHCPNGEYRTPGVAGRLKAMGTIPGVPDLLVWLPESMSFGIELKAGKGRLSADQSRWHSTLSSLGHRVYVCRSIDDVEAALRAEAVPSIGVLAAGRPSDAVKPLVGGNRPSEAKLDVEPLQRLSRGIP